MPQTRRDFLKASTLCVASVLALSGCGSKQHYAGFAVFAQWSTTVNHPRHPGKTGGPGISEAKVSGGLWDGDPVFVLWSPGPYEIGPGAVDPDDPRLRYRCIFPSGVVCACETPDGKTGTMRIADRSYDLDDGAFFLVLVDGDKARVKQLNRDLSKMKYEQENFEELAKSDAEIRAFFLEPVQVE